MCLSILKIYSSNSLKLRFPVAMPNCLCITSELLLAFLEKQLQHAKRYGLPWFILDDCNKLCYLNNVLGSFWSGF